MGITFITIKAVITALIITIPLLLLLVHRWRVGNIIIPTAGVVYAAALLPVAYLLSTIFASNKFSALLNINFNTDSLVIVTLGFLAMLSTILIGINKTYFKNINIYKLIIYLISVVLTLFTVKVLWQLITSELPVWLSSINLVGSWVDISAMLALLISMLMGGKILKLGGRYSRVFMVIIVTLLTLCLVVFVNVISIIAILALVSAMQIISVIYKNREVASSKVLFIIPAIVLVISGVFTVDNTMLNSKISTTLQNWTKISFVDVRPNWQGTLTVAKGTVVDSDITAKLFGPGVGSFEDQWRLYKPISVNSTQFWDTNFSYAIGFIPTSIITGGIIVFVAWAALFLMLLKLLIRNNKSNVAYPVLFIWLFMLFNPVDYILLIIAFILTGLLVVESINKNMTKSVKYRLRGEDMHKTITQ
ncbi:MAG: hypothetical protein LRZ97_00580, partial [Candidatus Pacebacteria bacterium]|nr:hypothetical protein [Candidatus Paceibacterota bacterium]